MSAAAAVPSPTLTVETVRFGTLTVPAETELDFPNGLPGFPEAHDFVLLPVRDRLAWLQSVDLPSLAFLLVAAAHVAGERWDGDPAGWAVVTFGQTPAEATANLMAPIVIDEVTGTAHQMISPTSAFTTAEPFDLSRI